MWFKSERSQASRYMVAFLTPVLVAAAMALTWPLFEANPVTIYLLAIVVSAWLGGLWPGIVALAVSLTLTNFFFIPPYYSLWMPDAENIVRMVTVGGIGIFVSVVCGSMQREYSRAEANLASVRLSESRFRTTLETMMEGCQIISFDWRYLYINEVAAEHGGTHSKNLIGKKMTDAFPGIENTEVFAVLRECMEGRTPREMENEFVGSDGVRRWFQLVIQPVPEGLFILSLDITERLKVIESIR